MQVNALTQEQQDIRRLEGQVAKLEKQIEELKSDFATLLQGVILNRNMIQDMRKGMRLLEITHHPQISRGGE